VNTCARCSYFKKQLCDMSVTRSLGQLHDLAHEVAMEVHSHTTSHTRQSKESSELSVVVLVRLALLSQGNLCIWHRLTDVDRNLQRTSILSASHNRNALNSA
jgi:hypothetical protein